MSHNHVHYEHNKLCRAQLKPDGTRWRMGGEAKGKLANGVGRQYSYTTSEHGTSSITTADAHTSAASCRLNWRPRRFKWTRPFRRKTKSSFCACAITFQTQSTIFNVFNQRHKAWQFTMYETKITYFDLNVKNPKGNIELKTHIAKVLVTHNDKQLSNQRYVNWMLLIAGHILNSKSKVNKM
jgi:hypothetical protein